MPAAVARDAQSSRPDQSLPRRLRIGEAAVFREALEHGRRFRGHTIILFLRSGPGANLRLGVIAGRRSLRRSVDRTRAKRLIREAFRRNRFRFEGNVDIVIVARARIKGASFAEVENDLLTLARRGGILDPSPPGPDGINRGGDGRK